MDRELRTGIVHSLTFNPWYNLALEEYLLNEVEEDQIILYLWQNENTVVIGRNQNAWKECRCRLLESEGGKLARRLSGGGAVFHDLGNLNFTFLMPRDFYDLEKQLEVILEAVRHLGIDAEFSGRNDLVVDGRKFSGNAFYLSERSAYHHGTILLEADFDKLSRYLQVSKEKIKSKGVESVRSRVVNLREIVPILTVGEVKRAMEDSFLTIYGGKGERMRLDPEEMDEIKKLYDKYSSWDWRYGQTPLFDITFNHRFTWGGVEIGLKLRKGYIEDAVIYSDAMDANLIDRIADVLKGVSFKREAMIEKIESISDRDTFAGGDKIIRDLIEWLYTKSI